MRARGKCQAAASAVSHEGIRGFWLNELVQRTGILASGQTPAEARNQTDFVKDRVALEVQFGKGAAFPLFRWCSSA